jgi:hypothetical protein
VIHLTSLSVAQALQRRMTEGLLKNELKGMWKETVVALLNLLSWHFPGETEEHHGNQS